MSTLKSLLSLRKFVAVVATTTALVFAVGAPSVAFAAAGGNGGGGGHGGFSGHSGGQSFNGHSGGHPGFVGHPDHRGFFPGHRGFVTVAPGFAWWGAYPYYAPDYAPAPSGYWYYCQSAGAYYPYVGSCPEDWVPVPSG